MNEQEYTALKIGQKVRVRFDLTEDFGSRRGPQVNGPMAKTAGMLAKIKGTAYGDDYKVLDFRCVGNSIDEGVGCYTWQQYMLEMPEEILTRIDTGDTIIAIENANNGAYKKGDTMCVHYPAPADKGVMARNTNGDLVLVYCTDFIRVKDNPEMSELAKFLILNEPEEGRFVKIADSNADFGGEIFAVSKYEGATYTDYRDRNYRVCLRPVEEIKVYCKVYNLNKEHSQPNLSDVDSFWSAPSISFKITELSPATPEDIEIYNKKIDWYLDNGYRRCRECNKWGKVKEVRYHQDLYVVCEDCIEDESKSIEFCDVCGELAKNPYSLYDHNGGDIVKQHCCRACLREMEREDRAFFCNYHDCYEVGCWDYDIEDYGYICEGAYCDGDFGYCEECDRYYCGGDLSSDNICYNCRSDDYDEDDDYYSDDEVGDSILPYHANIDTHYYDFKDGKRVEIDASAFKGFGVELEITKENRDDKVREHLSEITELTDEAFHYEHDGSIGNWGIEMITQPHTRSALMNIPWQEMTKKLTDWGYLSHKKGLCGMHIHISRKFFGDTEEDRTSAITKMVLFYQTFWDDCVKFSRRKPSQLHWCDKYDTDSRDKLEGFVKDKHYDRYKAVNLSNTRTDTIEVRLMRGTLKYETLIATLEFVAHIAEKSTTIDWNDIGKKDVWLDGVSDNVIAYMKERKCFGYEPEVIEGGDLETVTIDGENAEE